MPRHPSLVPPSHDHREALGLAFLPEAIDAAEAERIGDAVRDALGRERVRCER